MGCPLAEGMVPDSVLCVDFPVKTWKEAELSPLLEFAFTESLAFILNTCLHP